VGNDYPRLVALSHPRLQPDDSPQAIRHYSQQYVDLIDLEGNCLKTIPIGEALGPLYPPLRYLAQVEQDGYFSTPLARLSPSDVPRLAITYDEFLGRTRFPALLRELLQLLEQRWGTPVDVEFTVGAPGMAGSPGNVELALLQCRPLPGLQAGLPAHRPENLDPADVVLSSQFIVPDGCLPDIRHVLFVVPDKYFGLQSEAARRQVARVIGRVNGALPPKSFICVGPGRWGTENLDLGVFVGYADICNAGALVELSGKAVGPAPEPSLGTHFFHDLMEAQIYPIAANLDREDTLFLKEFFYGTKSCLSQYVPSDDSPNSAVRLIDVAGYRPGNHLEVIMDADEGKTTAYLAKD
jgi:hypothetical protein